MSLWDSKTPLVLDLRVPTNIGAGTVLAGGVLKEVNLRHAEAEGLSYQLSLHPAQARGSESDPM